MSVGSHCFECRQAAAPSTREKVRVAVALGTPYVSYTLLAMNLAAFVVAVPGSELQSKLLLWAVGVHQEREWYRIITSAFLHGSTIHLLANMFFLYRLGPLVERAVGPFRFAGIYAVALLGGSLGALALTAGNVATVGASGALYGLMGAMVVMSKRRGIGIWASGLGFMLLINALFTIGVPNISLGGHLGGIIAGAGITLALDSPRRHGPADAPDWLAISAVVVSSIMLFGLSLVAAMLAYNNLFP